MEPASLSHQQYIAGRGSQAYLNIVDTHSNTVGGNVHVGHLAIFELQPSYFYIIYNRAAALDHLSLQYED